jgi:hypothetical protein
LKAAETRSLGYDRDDDFDPGDFDRKGEEKTCLGNWAELVALVAKAHDNLIDAAYPFPIH